MESNPMLESDESVPESSGPPDEERVSIARAELESLREAARRAAESEAAGREATARELAERERRLAEREASHRAAVRDRELAVALAGRPLVPGAASQLLKLWREEFDVFEDEGRVRVAGRDGRGVTESVAAWLSSPEYAHFCPATSRGGVADPGPSAASAAPTSAAPRTLGELVLRGWQESAARPEEPSRPIGLRRRR